LFECTGRWKSSGMTALWPAGIQKNASTSTSHFLDNLQPRKE
jgi:hypothetical protein